MTERNDHSEYLVVIRSSGDFASEDSDPGYRIQTLRCNRKETAEEIAAWLGKSEMIKVRIFSDPPKIGQ